ASVLRSPDPDAQRAGSLAAARCGVREFATACRSALANASSGGEILRVVGAVGDPGDLGALTNLDPKSPTWPDAISALGRTGRPAAVARLLELADDPKLGAIALCAFRRITGANGALAPEPDAAATPDEIRAAREF